MKYIFTGCSTLKKNLPPFVGQLPAEGASRAGEDIKINGLCSLGAHGQVSCISARPRLHLQVFQAFIFQCAFFQLSPFNWAKDQKDFRSLGKILFINRVKSFPSNSPITAWNKHRLENHHRNPFSCCSVLGLHRVLAIQNTGSAVAESKYRYINLLVSNQHVCHVTLCVT